MKTPRERFILKSRVALLQRKGWAYLRYLHVRNALRMMKDCDSVLIVGGGFALAEVTLAAEHPQKWFTVTDHGGATHDFVRAREWVAAGDVRNVEFGTLDILQPGRQPRVDAVISVEVLEHIKEDRLAARNMLDLSRKATFCLVPFASASKNEDKVARDRAWRRHEHYVVGYNREMLRALFGSSAQVRGAYWADAGQNLRAELEATPVERIKADAARLLRIADTDLRESIPVSDKEAQGIKVLVRS